eukprot:g2387.t1
MPPPSVKSSAENANSKYLRECRSGPRMCIQSKEIGLSMLGFLLDAMDFEQPTLLSYPLKQLGDLFSTLPTNALFKDWYPPPRAPEEPISIPSIAVGKKIISASSQNVSSASGSASKRQYEAVDAMSDSGGMWLSKKGDRTVKWTINLSAAGVKVPLSSVHFSFSAKHTPQSVSLSVCYTNSHDNIDNSGNGNNKNSNSNGKFVEVASNALGSDTEWTLPIVLQLPDVRVVSKVQIQLSGFSRHNTSQQLSLRSVQLMGPHKASSCIVSVDNVLRSLQNCALHTSRHRKLRSRSLAVLCHLVRASGSLEHALALLSALLLETGNGQRKNVQSVELDGNGNEIVQSNVHAKQINKKETNVSTSILGEEASTAASELVDSLLERLERDSLLLQMRRKSNGNGQKNGERHVLDDDGDELYSEEEEDNDVSSPTRRRIPFSGMLSRPVEVSDNNNEGDLENENVSSLKHLENEQILKQKKNPFDELVDLTVDYVVLNSKKKQPLNVLPFVEGLQISLEGYQGNLLTTSSNSNVNENEESERVIGRRVALSDALRCVLHRVVDENLIGETKENVKPNYWKLQVENGSYLHVDRDGTLVLQSGGDANQIWQLYTVRGGGFLLLYNFTIDRYVSLRSNGHVTCMHKLDDDTVVSSVSFSKNDHVNNATLRSTNRRETETEDRKYKSGLVRGCLFRVIQRFPGKINDTRVFSRPCLPLLMPKGSIYLSELEQRCSSIGHGASEEIMVNGYKYQYGISMHTPANGRSFIQWTIPDGFIGWLIAAVALNDDVASSSVGFIFSVVCGGKELWTTQVSHSHVARNGFQVPVLGGMKLELNVKCPGSNSGAHAVWIDPVLIPCSLEPSVVTMYDALRDRPRNDSIILGGTILSILGRMAAIAMQDMRQSKQGKEISAVTAAPFCLLVRGTCFKSLHSLLQRTLEPDEKKYVEMTKGLLHLLEANLRRLVISRVRPSDVGVSIQGDLESVEPTLQPLLRTLENLIQPSDIKGRDQRHKIQQLANSVWDQGLPLFYATPSARKELACAATVDGVTIEVQFRFPTMLATTASGLTGKAKTGETADIRFERLILMLRLECEERRWQHDLYGKLGSFVHLVLSIPKNYAASFLSDRIATLCQNAGFENKWVFPVGVSDPNIRLRLERYLRFDRIERLESEHGVGWVRMYPTNVGSFWDVCKEVAKFANRQ